MKNQKIGEKKRKLKKTKRSKIKYIQNIIGLIVIICMLYNILFLVNTTISSKQYFKLFGISLFDMDNNLMKNDINKNDLIIAKEVEENELKEGDIIVYDFNGQIIVSKVYKINDGKYMTKLNQGYYLNREEINYSQIIGKVIKCLPFLGIVLAILQKKVMSIIVIILLILLYNYNNYLSEKKLERYRKKRRIEKERKE